MQEEKQETKNQAASPPPGLVSTEQCVSKAKGNWMEFNLNLVEAPILDKTILHKTGAAKMNEKSHTVFTVLAKLGNRITLF